MVQKIIRPRGRPASFNEGRAIQKATTVFWARGYDGVTIDDLVEGMGIARPSLYAKFGDKTALFMRCLEDYAEKKGGAAVQVLLETPDVLSALQGFLRHSVTSATAEGSPWGCLMICVAPLVDDERVREFLLRAAAQGAATVEHRLQEAVVAGELPPDFPCAMRTRHLLDLARGLTLRARLGESRESLFMDADDGAALILQPRQG
jgi:AcrR family transcriptional regulator